MSDDHIWVSVAARPNRSRFTRVQRLTTCAAILFILMLADAMFHEQEYHVKNDFKVRRNVFVAT